MANLLGQYIADNSSLGATSLGKPKTIKTASYRSLQALRAIAALLVVFFHVNHSIFSVAKYWPDLPLGRFFEFGHAGVYFFFVLSGFIIYAAHAGDIGDDRKIGAFLWKRFRRIYPVYWAMMLVLVPLYFLVPSFGTGLERQAGVLIDSFSLVHLFGDGAVVLTASWTLFHELLFYGVFCTLILNRRVGGAVLVVWLAACAATLLPGVSLPTALVFYLSPLHLLFGMGMAVAWLVARGAVPAPWVLGTAGIASFSGVAALDVMAVGGMSTEVLALAYGLGSALIVLAAVQLERQGALRLPKVLVFLGDASYSIYLVHFVALSLMAKIAVMVMRTVLIPHVAVYFALAVGSVAVGVAYHLAVEVPLLSLLGKRAAAGRAASVRQAASALVPAEMRGSV